MTLAQIKAALARQSTAALSALRQQHLGVPSHVAATKAQMVDALAAHFVALGGLPPSLAQVPAPAAPAAPVSDPRIEAHAIAIRDLTRDVVAVQNGMHVAQSDLTHIRSDLAKVAGDLVTVNRTVLDSVNDSAKSTKVLTDSLRSISEALTNRMDAMQASVTLDPTAVRAEIAAAVRTGFGEFAAAATASNTVADIVAAATAPMVIGRKSALDLFGVNACDIAGRPLEFDVWDDPTAPAVDPDFLWTPDILRALAGALAGGLNVWLGGDKGVGKSETARQFAARCGRAFTRVNFQKYSEAADFIGGTGILPDGSTGFVAGDFLLAYSRPGTVLLLDEISNCQPGALAVINGLLEPNAHQNIGGKFWTRAPGVMVLGADNTLGTGDESGQFGGTNQMNSATLDRFGLVFHMQWLPATVEAKAIAARTGCKLELADQVVACLNAARAKVQTGDIVSAPSIRSAMSFVTLLPIMGLDAAWDAAIANRQPSESAAALASIRAAFLNEQQVLSNV